MVNIKYANAYVEVLEILKYIPVEDYNKIPKNKIELFETNANNGYTFKYDISKTLDEQNVSKITKGIIAILFRDYWATESQREKIINKQNYNRMMIEKEKQEKYKPNGIFKQELINENSVNIEDTSIIEYKESLFLKILNKIKRILYISKK
ncbi:MAG: hypothetical protein HFJ28_00710 [Clostridia bacterium]|jgi:hypothetical protein|nr:hypothetical protein [Clostridia bacterium]